MVEPMLKAKDSTLQDIPIDLLPLYSVYIQVGYTAGRSYGAVVVDAHTGSAVLDISKSVN